MMTQSQQKAMSLLQRNRFFNCPDSSEDLASMVHLMLTIDFSAVAK